MSNLLPIRLSCLLLLTNLLGGCFQSSLGGPTGGTEITIAPLREPTNIIATATTSDDADWIELLGQARWDELPALSRLLFLGVLGKNSIDTSTLDPAAIYVLTASGGVDYVPDAGNQSGGTPETIQGSWHAIATGQRIMDGNLQISALTEASYRQVAARYEQLTDPEIEEQMGAAARLLVSDVNADGELNHDDVLAWSPSRHRTDYLGKLADLDALASGIRAAQPGVSLDALAKDVLGSARVVIATSFGSLTMDTLNWEAPVTADNFLRYVADNFYDNIVFHRTIDGFMIQTGLWELMAASGTVTQKPPREPIRNESQYTVSNLRGTVSMARTSDPDSASAQFFINQADNSFLDFGSTDNPDGYAVFARLITGYPVLDEIAGLPTFFVSGIGADVPAEIVVIESAVIEN